MENQQGKMLQSVKPEAVPLVIKAFHGTTSDFQNFCSNPAGIHVGSFEQAVHAATIKLGRIPASEFSKLTEDSHGWRGRILKIEAHVSNLKRVQDARTAEQWALAIQQARREGFDGLFYTNEFEGRQSEDSYVLFEPNQVVVVSREREVVEGPVEVLTAERKLTDTQKVDWKAQTDRKSSIQRVNSTQERLHAITWHREGNH